MTYFDKNPKSLYRNLEAKIPYIKIKNKNFMNKLHSLDMPADFWWVISGEFAILAERIIIQSADNPRLLNDIKNVYHIKSEASKEKVVSSVILNSIGREFILDKDLELHKNNGLIKNINRILIDIAKINESDEEEIDSKIEKSIPLKNLTNFLNQLRLVKFKYLFQKVKNRVQQIFSNKKNQHDDNKIFYSKNTDREFEILLELLLPENHERYFPIWFVRLSEYLVKSSHKWVTTFGQPDIYQKILIAKSYQKFGSKNITVIQHGLLFAISSWHLYRFSLFPDMKLKTINESLDLPKIYKPDYSYDILFCPTQIPFIFGDFFSLENFWDFMKVYRSAIKIIIKGLNNKKKIKIRYKNFKYMSGFGGPLTREECVIPIENDRFEDVFHKYKLIVSMPFGTIAGKCFKNNINYISYHYPFSLTDTKSYLKIKKFPGVFTESKNFLEELERQINEL